MPSVFTHYKFACDALGLLSEGLAGAVEAHRKLYDTGQSGADLLFYYRPHQRNELRKHGSDIHRVKAAQLFFEYKTRALASADFSADAAYLTGFFTHFILDSVMHPYIWKCDKEGISPHFVIEADYERKLMLKEGVNPHKADFLSYQVNDDEVATTAAKYLDCTPRQVRELLTSRVRFTKLISSANPLTRGLLKFAFKISDNPKGNDVLMPLSDVPACQDISAALDLLYEKALSDIKEYSPEFEKFLLHDGSLSDRFDRDFE